MNESLVQMPHNAEAFYRKGYRAMEEGEFEKGVEYLEQSLALIFNLTTFTELIQGCLSYNKVANLKGYWEKYMPDTNEVAKHEFLSLLYMDSIEVMIEPRRRLLELVNFREKLARHQIELMGIDHRIENYQKIELSRIKLADIIDRNAEEEYVAELLKNSQFDILVKLKEMYYMDHQIILPIFKLLLLSKNCSNFAKADIIHHLIYQNIYVELEMFWFDQKKVIDIKELKFYTLLPLYQETLKLIEKHFEQEDVYLEVAVREQLVLQAMVLYPFYELCDLTPEKWKNYLIAQLHQGTVKSVMDTDELHFYLQKADAEIKEIFTEGRKIFDLP